MDLILDDVSHGYDGLAVLRDVSLTLRTGETLAIVGPSGCGKSTLLGLMGGLLRPDSGRVRLDGDPPPGSLNTVTYVFQDFALLPWRSVERNVALALEHHRLPAAALRERVAEVLRRVGLTDFAAAFPKQLSGGMRQRVGIARALAVRPAILLLDEPLSALDAQTRELLMDDFADLWTGETSAAYVTHNLDEAVRLADRVAVLSRRPGRLREVVAVGVPRHDRTRPEAAGAMAAIRARLWDLIRGEAAAADREIGDARTGREP